MKSPTINVSDRVFFQGWCLLNARKRKASCFTVFNDHRFVFPVSLVAFSLCTRFLFELVQFFIEILTVWLTDAHRKDMQNVLSCALCRNCSVAAELFLAPVLQLRMCHICSVLNCLIKISTKCNSLHDGGILRIMESWNALAWKGP